MPPLKRTLYYLFLDSLTSLTLGKVGIVRGAIFWGTYETRHDLLGGVNLFCNRFDCYHP